jgi:hypothetical protein
MTPPLSKETHKVGSDGDTIRQRLFASQSMNELLQGLELRGGSSPFQTIADAAKLAAEGKNEEAISCLRSILSITNLETRIQLWVWSALRELGEQPESRVAWEVIGVVIEVPMKGAYDTLAAYQDGSARYLNYSGSTIFWDIPDETIKGLCQALLRSTVPAGSRAKPRVSLLLPKSGAQATLLTRSGIYAISDPPESVVKAAALLMRELIHRANSARGQTGPATK